MRRHRSDVRFMFVPLLFCFVKTESATTANGATASYKRALAQRLWRAIKRGWSDEIIGRFLCSTSPP